MKLRTGDILTAQILELPAFNHIGILVICGDDKFVYHNTPTQTNKLGGNVVREPLAQWLDGRKLLSWYSSGLSRPQIESAIILKSTKKFNVINYNCEHFISDVIEGNPQSPQLIRWLIVIIILYILWGNYKTNTSDI